MAAVARFAGWQLRSRLAGEIVVDWIDGAKLVVRRGMTGATGNIYCGLHEFVEMAFVLHVLRPGDLLLDIGANIGSYTVLASRLCGARTIAFEPDPGTVSALKKNIAANGLEGLARVEECALGDRNGEIQFTVGLDTVNRVAEGTDLPSRTVAVRRLDDVCRDENPALIKMDVEGFEDQVLTGAERVLAKPSLLAVQSEFGGPILIQTLSRHGFEPRYYDPFTRALSVGPVGHNLAELIFVRDSAELIGRLTSAPQRTIHGVTF